MQLVAFSHQLSAFPLERLALVLETKSLKLTADS
jgi:hypothetical protein